MEQDWSTVRGKKINKRTISSSTTSHGLWENMETTILININNIVECEFSKLKPFISPFPNGTNSETSLKAEYKNID